MTALYSTKRVIIIIIIIIIISISTSGLSMQPHRAGQQAIK